MTPAPDSPAADSIWPLLAASAADAARCLAAALGARAAQADPPGDLRELNTAVTALNNLIKAQKALDTVRAARPDFFGEAPAPTATTPATLFPQWRDADLFCHPIPSIHAAPSATPDDHAADLDNDLDPDPDDDDDFDFDAIYAPNPPSPASATPTESPCSQERPPARTDAMI